MTGQRKSRTTSGPRKVGGNVASDFARAELHDDERDHDERNAIIHGIVSRFPARDANDRQEHDYTRRHDEHADRWAIRLSHGAETG